MKVYSDAKTAISELAGVNKRKLKKKLANGMEHDKIYTYKDRLFKITSSRQEYFAAKRIIGNRFKNVLTIYDCFKCDIVSDNGDEIWRSYIIEEEILYRKGNQFVFNSLDLYSLAYNIESRLPYFVSIINGLVELSSIGIQYNDLHPLNVMKDKNNVIKIIDFGQVSLKRNYSEINKKLYFT